MLGDSPTIAVTYKVKVTPRLVLVVLGPYFYQKIKEQITAVFPISLFLVLFQFVVIRQGVVGSIEIALGLGMVILGLMFFMEGLRLGLMPLGESIGAALPERAALWLVLAFCFIVGFTATLAEPAIATLKTAATNIEPEKAPLLYNLLSSNSGLLVASVGAGVGLATVVGGYRFIRHWSLTVVLFPTLALALALTILAQLHPITRDVVALAWDTGGITTGPVTVPLVLALGLGICAALGKSETGMSGFGIVTLASLWPVVTVLITSLALFYSGNYASSGEFRGSMNSPNSALLSSVGFIDLLTASVQAAAQAIIPLVLLLYTVQHFVLRKEVDHPDQIVLGIVLALFGLLLFNLGLSSGLVPLGQQAGSGAPLAFAPPKQLYGETGGRIVVLLFAFLLGYGATLAEPALNALGRTVEEVTVGAFKRIALIHAVAFGVGMGLAVGIAKIMFGWPLAYLVLPAYLTVAVLTAFSDEEFINIGWDSAGVTTGPITVPLVLAMGLGIGLEVGASEGFGMLAMASIGPIATVLALGMFVTRTKRLPKR